MCWSGGFSREPLVANVCKHMGINQTVAFVNINVCVYFYITIHIAQYNLNSRMLYKCTIHKKAYLVDDC